MDKSDIQQESDDAVQDLRTEIAEIREKIETTEPPITRAELTDILHKELFRHAYNADTVRRYDIIRAELMAIKNIVEPKPNIFTNLHNAINSAIVNFGHNIRNFEMSEGAAYVSIVVCSCCCMVAMAVQK